jgi:hypothetical protein
MANFDRNKQDGVSRVAQDDYRIMKDIKEGRRDPKDVGGGIKSGAAVRYTKVQDKILVEYAARGNDVVFQISPPKRDMKYWRNIKNKELYSRMFKIIDEYGKIPTAIRKTVGGPTPDSAKFKFDKITIVFHELAQLPFAMKHVRRAAEALASRLY